MSENSIGKVRIGRFQNSEKTPSASAFVQQRQKLLPAALETLFHPFTPMAIIDLIAILPSFTMISPGFRLMKIFRVFRSFKMFRYSKSIGIIVNVIQDQRGPLLAICSMAVGYALISALVIFNVEPETFGSFFDAVYWATVSLTTMGYGDIYPVTTIGRIVTMLSSFVGISIVTLPSGIITAGYMDQLKEERDRK